MSFRETSAAPEPARWSRDLLVLTVFFGALNFFLLGRLPLANPDEARYAEIPREMLARGEWVTPRLNDTPYFEKPPLVYWTVGLSRWAFGSGEFAARLTPALFGLGGILLTYAAGRRLFGREAGLAAAIVLGTSVLYFVLSRVLLLDMAVSVLMSATLFCFILGVREPARDAEGAQSRRGQAGRRRRWFFHGLYASAALATLAKGLIGFLIPGAIMLLWLLLFNQWRRLRPLHLPGGIVIFIAIAAPWHVLVALRNPEWVQFYFVHEHWGRFASTAHLRAEPFWFFVPVVALGLFPWIGFLGGAVREAVGTGGAQRRENADAWFFITWAAFVFLFFSAAQSKLIPYILPVFPPLAVLIGAWLARQAAPASRRRPPIQQAGTPPPRLPATIGRRLQVGSSRQGTMRMGLGVFAFVCGLLAVALLTAVVKPGIIRDPEQTSALRPFGFALAAILLLGGVAAPWAARVRGAAAALGTVVGTMLGFFLVLVIASPGLQRAGTKDLALIARERVLPGERVYHYWAFFHDFVYYLERPVGLVSYVDELEVQFLDPAGRAARFIDDDELRRQWAGPARVWLVVRKRDQKLAGSVFNDPAFRYHLIAGTRGHSLLSNHP